ncbi:MAG: hypothetical protein LUI02_05995, partial [Clostridiales bacterium]|nr:hypothetical protein [Clostridiales bacterium]
RGTHQKTKRSDVIMKNKSGKIISALVLCVALAASTVTAYAATPYDTSEEKSDAVGAFIDEDSEYYLTADGVVDMLSEEELETIGDDEVILGGVNLPIFKMNNGASSDSEVITVSAVGQIWCQSYATYSSSDGLSVYVKLYVPLGYANPKFTSMSGTVTVATYSKSKIKSFSVTANSTSTIDATIDTGLVDSAGAKGNVSVTGIATGNNIQDGAGAFETSYSITIPDE